MSFEKDKFPELNSKLKSFLQLLQNIIIIRDVDIIGTLDIGVQALGTMPVRSEKKNQGEVGVDVSFGGLTFQSGDYVYADNNGLLLSKKELNLK